MLDELGIKSIRLDLPFRLNHVNCFLAEGNDGYTVIDTGLNNEKTIKRWNQEIDGKKISDIIITHYHPDHFGYAGGMQNKTGSKLSMTKIDMNAANQAWEEAFLNSLSENYAIAGIPVHMAKQMVENTLDFVPLVTPYPTVDHYLEEGEKAIIGKYEYEVIFTPGHSDGLVTFYNPDKRVLLSTDHILPKITPNISYWFHGNQDPLATYLQSLEKVKKLDADYVIPSHGKPFYGANERIDEIIKHHHERLDETLEYITADKSVYDLCQNLFPRELSVHETRFAIGETLAHLEYLYHQGDLKRFKIDGKWHYEK